MTDGHVQGRIRIASFSTEMADFQPFRVRKFTMASMEGYAGFVPNNRASSITMRNGWRNCSNTCFNSFKTGLNLDRVNCPESFAEVPWSVSK